MIKVLVVDDKAAVRSMLAEQIDNTDDCQVVGQAETGRQALELARHLWPDVILMDIEMPGVDGIAATRILVREQPKIRVLILTYIVNPAFVAAAISCGACGYIIRGSDTVMIVNEIRAAHASRLVIDSEFITLIRQKLADLDSQETTDQDHAHKMSRLTAREVEILNLMAAGYKTMRIKQELSIEKTTLEHHIEHIYSKIGEHSRAEAIVWARQRGLGVAITETLTSNT